MYHSIFHRYHPSFPREKLQIAEFRDRIISQLIDGIILGFFCSILFLIFSHGKLFSVWAMPVFPIYLLQQQGDYLNDVSKIWWGGYFHAFKTPWGAVLNVAYPAPLVWLVYAFYYTYFIGNYGQTPGKMLKKLVVLESNHHLPGFQLSFLRWISYFIPCLTLGGALLPVVLRNTRAWHDVVCKTQIYNFD
jgi:uncharacterized RDD family membrane protein YckC